MSYTANYILIACSANVIFGNRRGKIIYVVIAFYETIYLLTGPMTFDSI